MSEDIRQLLSPNFGSPNTKMLPSPRLSLTSPFPSPIARKTSLEIILVVVVVGRALSKINFPLMDYRTDPLKKGEERTVLLLLLLLYISISSGSG